MFQKQAQRDQNKFRPPRRFSRRRFIIGAVLVLIGIVVAVAAERGFVEIAKQKDLGASEIISLPNAQVDPANENKIVHISALADPASGVEDKRFGVNADVLILQRTVEMYQWQENANPTTRNPNPGVTYSAAWSSETIDSTVFQQPAGHLNPTTMPYASDGMFPTDARLGEFDLTETNLVRLIDKLEPYMVEEVASSRFPDAKTRDNYVYLNSDPDRPQVGDVRIKYTAVKPQVISIVGRQYGSRLIGWQTLSGIERQEIVTLGNKTAQQMLSNSIQTMSPLLYWLLRLLAIACIAGGMWLVIQELRLRFSQVRPFRLTINKQRIALAGLGASLYLIIATVIWASYQPFVAIVTGLLACIALSISMGLIVGLSRKPKQSVSQTENINPAWTPPTASAPPSGLPPSDRDQPIMAEPDQEQQPPRRNTW